MGFNNYFLRKINADYRSVFIIAIVFSSFSVSAQEQIDSLRALLQQNISDTARVIILNDICRAFMHSDPFAGQDDVAVAFNLAQKISYNDGIADSYKNMGNINSAIGNYPQALIHFHNAVEHYQITGNNEGLAYCYNNIGEMYKLMEDLKKSAEYHLLAIAIKEQQKLSSSLLTSYNNLAETYLYSGRLREANEYYKKALSHRNIATHSNLFYSYLGNGQIKALIDSVTLAEAYYDSARTHIIHHNNFRDLSKLDLKEADLFLQLKIFDSAKHYYRSSFQQASIINAKDLQLSSIYGLMIADSTTRNYREALSNLLVYNFLKDSVINEKNLNQVARLEAEFNNQLLKQENEMNMARVKQQNILIIGIIMIMLLLIALAATFYQQQKNQSRINHLLASKNQEILQQKEKIECQAQKVSNLNIRLELANLDLESKIKERTALLVEQNKKLAAYAYTNAHELRAPLANILGIVNLLKKSELTKKEEEMVAHLSKASYDLDKVVQEIRRNLEEEVNKKEEIV